MATEDDKDAVAKTKGWGPWLSDHSLEIIIVVVVGFIANRVVSLDDRYAAINREVGVTNKQIEHINEGATKNATTVDGLPKSVEAEVGKAVAAIKTDSASSAAELGKTLTAIESRLADRIGQQEKLTEMRFSESRAQFDDVRRDIASLEMNVKVLGMTVTEIDKNVAVATELAKTHTEDIRRLQEALADFKFKAASRTTTVWIVTARPTSSDGKLFSVVVGLIDSTTHSVNVYRLPVKSADDEEFLARMIGAATIMDSESTPLSAYPTIDPGFERRIWTSSSFSLPHPANVSELSQRFQKILDIVPNESNHRARAIEHNIGTYRELVAQVMRDELGAATEWKGE